MPDFDPRTPSIARVYDYLLGGKDNFAADRAAGDRLIAVFPAVVEAARENRRESARLPATGQPPCPRRVTTAEK